MYIINNSTNISIKIKIFYYHNYMLILQMQILKENLLTIQCMSNVDDLNQNQSEEHLVSNKIPLHKNEPINTKVTLFNQLLNTKTKSGIIPITEMQKLHQSYTLKDQTNDHTNKDLEELVPNRIEKQRSKSLKDQTNDHTNKDLEELVPNRMKRNIQSIDLKKIQKESYSISKEQFANLIKEQSANLIK